MLGSSTNHEAMRTAVISGGLGDIGQAIAHAFGAEGYSVGISDLANALPSEDATHDFPLRYDPCDVTDPDQVRRWFDAVQRELGVPRAIVVNAAVVSWMSVLEITPERWARDVRVNLDGAFHMAQEGARRLIAAREPGSIVFIGSWVAEHADPMIPAYCASKAGMRSLMRSLAIELAPYDITVNEVAPGYVDAGLSGKVYREDPARREASEARVPVRRLLSAADVAHQVVQLCGPNARHQTGSTLTMDGGLSLLHGRRS